MNTIFKRIIFINAAVLIGILLLALTVGVTWAQGPTPGNPQDGFGWGRGPGFGMRQGWSQGFGQTGSISGTMPYGYGPGPMGGGPGMGPGMMRGWRHGGFDPTTGLTDTVPFGGFGPGGRMGRGMMGRWGNNITPQGEPITAEEAVQAVETYLAAYNNPDLVIDEVMTFSRNFYVDVKEESTGRMAFELLVDPSTGFVHPEPGPNMMWNTKYGHMAQWSGTGQAAVEMSVTPDQAREYAQKFLDTNLPGVTVEDEAEAFYGYYTLHTLRDGQIEGMLSVNGYTGQVWYHHWHGDFIGMEEGASTF